MCVCVKYKCGRRLVGDRTAKSRLSDLQVTESQFADDVDLYCSSCQDFQAITKSFVEAIRDWGLTVSLDKTKGMVFGRDACSGNAMEPVQVGGGDIKMVNKFVYLGSCVSEISQEVSNRIGKASKAFGCLRQLILRNQQMSVDTKKSVYKAVVAGMPILQYGSETWAVNSDSLRCLEPFHNQCGRSILGVTKHHQWKNRITTRQLASDLGMSESMSAILSRQSLHWLGHVPRMNDSRLPKQVLFGELLPKRPCNGVKRRWGDLVSLDLKCMEIPENAWYMLSQDRVKGKDRIDKRSSVILPNQSHFTSAVGTAGLCLFECGCGRSFRQKGDLTRHSRFCGVCQ